MPFERRLTTNSNDKTQHSGLILILIKVASFHNKAHTFPYQKS